MTNIHDLLTSTVTDILGHLAISPSFTISESTVDDSNTYNISIEGNNLNYLIGYRGESLLGLQHFLTLVLFQSLGEWHRVTVDINGYKASRQEKLEDIARHAIDKVRFFRSEVELRPMSSYERRLLHVFIAEYDDVETLSIGEGRDRRVVIKLKDEN